MSTSVSTDAYTTTIGLEVHAELATETKMFCACLNNPDETRANVNVCPVCMAHPGTLPVPNRAAIEKVLRVGRAVGSRLADYTEFDRKSYFYPDIPKGYQISQYEYPLVSGGTLGGVELTRIHLEEDTARSSHEGTTDTSEVDFNRAGVPLMELVTEPVIHDAQTAGRFARELQLLLRTLGVSHAELAKGEMRIEANISVSKTETFGTKVEVKNLNSFRSVERAIAYEVDRQIALIESGGTVSQETRGWDEGKQSTFRQRSKEGSADYRYFPEPDIPKIKRSEIPEWRDEALASTLPELPWERRTRYSALGLSSDAVEFLLASPTQRAFFDEVIEASGSDSALAKAAAVFIVNDLPGLRDGNEAVEVITPQMLVKLVRMNASGALSSRGAKDTLAIMAVKGGDPEVIATEQGFVQVSDPEALRTSVREVLASNPAAVEEYRQGKDSILQFLVGQSMKATRGAGNPGILRELLLEELPNAS